MYAVVVSFQIEADRVAEFMPLMLANARQSRLDEPGCLQFDVCTDLDRPGQVFLYELYSDRAAFDAHLTSPHFTEFDRAVAAMIASKTVATYPEVTQ